MGDVNFECIVVSLRVDFCKFYFVCCTDRLVNNRYSTHCFPLCVPLTVMYFQTFIWLVILMLMYQTTIILYFLNFFVSTASFSVYQVVKSFTHSRVGIILL